ncbi:MAG: ferrochelatase [Steroidobacteraceae bacterium]|nr:ferrochelatase [Nevskiaceae bacterium]
MRRVTKRLGIAVLMLLVLGVGGYGYYRHRNVPPQLAEPNWYTYYQQQDLVPHGKVGVLVTQLFMPETFRAEDYYNIALKATQYIPWPVRALAMRDRGVVLLDPARPYEFESFQPKRLVDLHGSERDIDGIRYVEKLARGDVRWVPPDRRQHLDHGYFLLTTRKSGFPTLAGKLMTKARLYYHDLGFVDHRLPHEAGMRAIAEASMARLQQAHGPIPWRFATADHFGLLEEAVDSLLDEGVETLLIAPAAPVYSHHEEFNGGFRHAIADVRRWEARHGRKVKVILAPQLGDFAELREAFLAMLRDRLDTLPAGKETDVKIVVSMHGMPWDSVPHEAWLELAPPYRDGMLADVRAVLAGYDFGRTEVVLSQDHFADPINNPKGRYLSTNQAFWDGIRARYDYVINLPIEFFAENTDTMFSHAMFNFEGFPGFDRYERIDYSDWTVPYTREFLVEGTRVIYNGVPVGRYNAPIVEAHFRSMDSILQRASSRPAAVAPEPVGAGG